MQYLVNRTDLGFFLKNRTREKIESCLVCLYLEKIKRQDTKNAVLRESISCADRDQTEEISSHISKRKIDLNLEYLASLFELLTPVKERTASGVFTTPELVANHLAAQTIDRIPKSVCDPACGSGALLLAAVRRIAGISDAPIKKIIEKVIYGADIHQRNIDHSKILLSLLMLENGEDSKDISFNLACQDSLLSDWGEKFPDVFSKDLGFEVILCNPPYASADFGGLSSSPISFGCLTKTTLPAFIPFVELMFHISNSSSNSGYIVPLSISYGKTPPFRKLRCLVANGRGDWSFDFYDRSPDSLFGDSVKIRSCIIIHKNRNHPSRVFTSHLIRWNSRIRDGLFRKQIRQHVGSFNIEDAIPKISRHVELDVLSDLAKKPALHGKISFGKSYKPETVSDSKNCQECRIFYYPTAYNWLSVFRRLPPSSPGTSLNSLRPITCESPQEADFLYAVLNSKTAYWWWLVFGDGFHLDHETLHSIPLNPENFDRQTKLIITEHAESLHAESTKFPIFSVNSGTRTMNFNMLQCSGIIGKIDEQIIAGLGIDPGFADFLNQRVRSHIGAGRKHFKNKELLENGGLKARAGP